MPHSIISDGSQVLSAYMNLHNWLLMIPSRNRRRNIHPKRVRLRHSGHVTFSCTVFLREIVYIAPSGVQKERIKPEHIFVLPYPQPAPPEPRIFLRKPTNNLKESACTPLFWNAFDLRDAGSCIHTHSQHAVMATLLWPGETFEISHLEVWERSDRKSTISLTG